MGPRSPLSLLWSGAQNRRRSPTVSVHAGTCSFLHPSYLFIDTVSFPVCCVVTVRNGRTPTVYACMLSMVKPSEYFQCSHCHHCCKQSCFFKFEHSSRPSGSCQASDSCTHYMTCLCVPCLLVGVLCCMLIIEFACLLYTSPSPRDS